MGLEYIWTEIVVIAFVGRILAAREWPAPIRFIQISLGAILVIAYLCYVFARNINPNPEGIPLIAALFLLPLAIVIYLLGVLGVVLYVLVLAVKEPFRLRKLAYATA